MHRTGEITSVGRVIGRFPIHRASASHGSRQLRPIVPLPAQEAQIGTPVIRTPGVQFSPAEESGSIDGPLLVQQPCACKITAKDLKPSWADFQPPGKRRNPPGAGSHSGKEVQIEGGQEDAGKAVSRDLVAEFLKRRNPPVSGLFSLKKEIGYRPLATGDRL